MSEILKGIWSTADRCIYGDKDPQKFLALCAEGVTLLHAPTMSGGRGKAEVARFLTECFVNHIPPDWTSNNSTVLCEGRTLVCKRMVSFTHSTCWSAFAPRVSATNRTVQHNVVIFVEFDASSLIASVEVLWDMASLLVQLGQIEPAHVRLDHCLLTSQLYKEAAMCASSSCDKGTLSNQVFMSPLPAHTSQHDHNTPGMIEAAPKPSPKLANQPM